MKYLIPAFLIWLIWTGQALAQSPPITVTLTTGDPTDDFIFTAPSVPGNNWLTIMDSSGRIEFSRQFPNRVFDFKAQGDKLTYFTGYFEVLDQYYQLIDTWKAVGYPTDNHDLQLLDNGNALLLVYKPRTVDLSAYGGHVTATVISCVIQEIGADKSLVWEWDGWDHNPISDTIVDLTLPRVDYEHCNAVEQDHDGNILLSERTLDQITKIDRQTGAVIWKLGGKANEFTFTNDAGFLYQHDIRRLANGNITIFDNGRAPLRDYSRAVEYEIDEVGKVITRTWEFRGPLAGCCGNVQRIESGPGAGNTLINFGSAHPTIVEVNPQGEVVFEADTPFSYRSFRLPWRRWWWLPVIWDSSAGSRQ